MIIITENENDFKDTAINNAQVPSILRLKSLSRIYFRKQWKEETHAAEDTTIYFVQTGKAYGQVDGKIIDVPENHFLLVKRGHETGFFISPAERTFLYIMTVQIENVPSYDALKEAFLMGRNAHIDDLFYHLFRSTKMKMNLETTPDAVAGLILEQCLGVLRSAGAGEELYRRFTEYVENNIGGDLSADAISAALSYNKDYLCRIVKKFSGKSLKEYISVEKLYIAKYMLSGKEASLKEISETLGFASTELFSKFFRYYTNISPLEYRRESRV